MPGSPAAGSSMRGLALSLKYILVPSLINLLILCTSGQGVVQLGLHSALALTVALSDYV